MASNRNQLTRTRPLNRLKRAWNRTRLAARYYLLPRRAQRPLFVLAEPRTGSTLIGDYLNSIPGVSVASEILSPTLPCGVPAEGVSQAAALRHVAWSLNALPGRVVGAKFLLEHLALHDVTLEDLHREFPDALYLIIYRASLIEQFVSFQVAKLTNKWVGRAGTEKFKSQIRLEPDAFVEFCRRQREKYASLLAHPWLASCGRTVCYEELAADPQRVFDESVFPLLGVPPVSVATSMVKQIDRDMRDVIENFSEVDELIGREGTQHYSLNSKSVVPGEGAVGDRPECRLPETSGASA